MKKSLKTAAEIVLVAACLMAAQGCGSSFEAESTPPPEHLRIDGKADEWQDRLLFYRDAGLTIGISNDASFLYLCIMSADEPVNRSLIMRGFTVWFDTTGGKGKYFGIRYPVGMDDAAMLETEDEQSGRRDELLKRSADQASKLAVIGPEKNDRTEILLPGKNGVEACIGYHPGSFIDEIKIPLGVTIADGLKLAFSSGGMLGIRFETAEREEKPSKMKRQETGGNEGMDAAGGEGGFGQQRAGGRRRSEGHMLGENAHQTKSIDLFMKVHAAAR